MSSTEAVAIIRQSVTVSLTFTSKPDEATRQRLKDAGYKFENGNWYRNETTGDLADMAKVHEVLSAS